MDRLPEDCARLIWGKVFNECVRELNTKENGTISVNTRYYHINRVSNFLKSLRPHFSPVIDMALETTRLPYTIFCEIIDDHLIQPIFQRMFPENTQSTAWEAYCFYHDAIHHEMSMFNIPHTKHWAYVY